MELYEMESTGKGKVLQAFAETPDPKTLKDAVLRAKLWSAMNPKKHGWLMVDSLRIQKIDAMPSYEDRQKIIAEDLGTASFSEFQNHVLVLDDMAHYRDELIVNWVATMTYIKGGGPTDYIVGGNILLVPRYGD